MQTLSLEQPTCLATVSILSVTTIVIIISAVNSAQNWVKYGKDKIPCHNQNSFQSATCPKHHQFHLLQSLLLSGIENGSPWVWLRFSVSSSTSSWVCARLCIRWSAIHWFCVGHTSAVRILTILTNQQVVLIRWQGCLRAQKW